jgi:Flp pilus assembly pilin Flp
MKNIFTQIFKSKKAATAIEYALLATLFAVTCAVAYNYLSGSLSAAYSSVGDSVTSANN